MKLCTEYAPMHELIGVYVPALSTELFDIPQTRAGT